MQIVSTKASAKVAAVAASLAMASAMLSFVPAVHAATCSVGTTDLTVGSTGDAVKCLQEALIAGKYLVMPVGVTTGTFGPLTKAAVMKWQADVKVPSTGYFGPLSRAAFNAGTGSTGGSSTCTTKFDPNTGLPCANPTTPDAPGALEGTDGIISEVTELGSYNNEEVGEGQEGVKVLGAEIEASTDGDIALKSVKVSFNSTGNTGSDNLDDYISGVSIMLGDKEVGSADVDDFNESGNVFSKVITLSGNTTVKADETVKLYVAVDAANTFDSSDISGDSWEVDVDSIRFVDGSGVYTTDSSTSPIGSMNVGVDFVSFSSAADTELKLSTHSSSPDEGIVVVDDSDETEDVSLLKGKLKLEGTSDAVLEELPVTFTVAANGTGATANGVDDVVSQVTLKIGDEEYTETMTLTSALTGTITFDDLDFAMDAGETVEFEVLADINDADGTVFVSGMVVKADVTSTNRNYIDIENEEGDQLSDSTEKSGTVVGEYQELRTNGIGLTLNGTPTFGVTAGTGSNDDLGTFTIKFKVTAIEDTVYISSLADAVTGSSVTTGKTSVKFERGSTATTGGTTVTIVDTTDDSLNAAGLFEVEEGTTHNFEVTGTGKLPAFGSSGQFRMSLIGVSWGTSSTDATPNNAYTSSLDSFKTTYFGLN